jgi:hypothetical protein
MNPLLLLALATVAVTPTPVISATPTSNEIQKIREVVQEKVQEKLKQITTQATTKKGLIGKVIQLDQNQITIEYQSNTQVLKINSSTVYVDANRNKTKLDNIKIGQDILALGTADSVANTFQATRIVFIDLKTINISKTIVIGKIVDISKTTPIFTLIPSKNKNTQYQIKTDAKTEVYSPDNNKIAVKDLKSGSKIIVILTPDPKATKTYYASKILDLDYALPVSPTPTPKTP